MSAEKYLRPVTSKKARGDGVVIHMRVNEPMKSRFIPGVIFTFERHGDGEGWQKYFLRVQEDDSTDFTDGLRFRGGILKFRYTNQEMVLAEFTLTQTGFKIDLFGGEAVSFFSDEGVVLSFSSVESFPLHVNEYAKKR